MWLDSISGVTDDIFVSAIAKLVRTLGSHPSDPGSSPGSGILCRRKTEDEGSY